MALRKGISNKQAILRRLKLSDNDTSYNSIMDDDDSNVSDSSGDKEEMLRTKMKQNEEWQMLKKTIKKGDKMAETAMNF